MGSKVHGISIFWMLVELILSVWAGARLYEYESVIAWIPTIIIVIWMICPFILKLCGLGVESNLIPTILFALVCLIALSSFGGLLFGALFAFLNFIAAVGYSEFAYELVDNIRDKMHYKRKNKLIRPVRIKIQQRIENYKTLSNILSKAEAHQKADKLIELLALCSNLSIRESYIEKCNERNIAIVRQIEEINNQNMLKLNIHDKTISQIKREVDEKLEVLQNDKERLETSSISEIRNYDI